MKEKSPSDNLNKKTDEYLKKGFNAFDDDYLYDDYNNPYGDNDDNRNDNWYEDEYDDEYDDENNGGDDNWFEDDLRYEDYEIYDSEEDEENYYREIELEKQREQEEQKRIEQKRLNTPIIYEIATDDDYVKNSEFYDSEKIFTADHEVHRLASAKIKNIVSRMTQNMGINIDDFQFLISAQYEENAFFIPKSDTHPKNIICISDELLKNCQNDDELAGILGHELGHFIWKNTLGGKNSVFQEQSADIKSVDLLINGGYNPNCYLHKIERLFQPNYRYYLEVHGQNNVRIDNVKAYMTKLAQERGDFPEISDAGNKEYADFIAKIKNAEEKNPYQSYYHKLIAANKPYIESDPRLGKIYLMSALMEKGIISDKNISRFYQMMTDFHQLRYQIEYPANNECLNKFIANSYPIILSKRTKIGYVLSTSPLISHSEDLQNITKYYHLNELDIFQQQYRNIENLVNAPNAQEALHWAKEAFKLRWTVDFKDFSCPNFKPLTENCIGKKQPWDALQDYAKNQADEDKRAADWCCQVLSPKSQSSQIEENKKPQNKSKFYKYDENGMYINFPKTYTVEHEENAYYEDLMYVYDENHRIVSYGKENLIQAKQKKLDEIDEKAQSSYLYFASSCKMGLDIYQLIDKISTTDDIAQKEILIKNLAKMNNNQNEYGSLGSNAFGILDYIPEYNNPTHRRRRNIEQLLTQYQTYTKDKNFSPVNKKSELTEAQIKQSIEQSYIYTNTHKYNEILEIKDPQRRRQELRDYADAYQLRIMHIRMSPTSNIEIKKYLYNQLASQLNNNLSRECQNIIMEQLYRFTHHHDIENYSNIRDISLYPLIEDYNKKNNRLKQNYLKLSYRYGSNIYTDLLNQMYEKTMDDINKNREPTLVEQIAQKLNIKNPNNLEEVFNLYQKLKGIPSEQKTFEEKEQYRFIELASYSLIINSLTKTKDFDLKQTLNYIYNIVPKRSIYHSLTSTDEKIYSLSYDVCEQYNTILAQKIKASGQFEQLPLKEKLRTYEIMEHKNIFSNQCINQDEYLSLITTEIITNPNREESMLYADALLHEKLFFFPQDTNNYNIKSIKEENNLIDFYTQVQAQKFGLDDDTPEYSDKILTWAQKNQPNPETPQRDFPILTYKKIINKLSTNIESQEHLALALADISRIKVSGSDAEKYDKLMRGVQELIDIAYQDPKIGMQMIEFINHPYSTENAENLKKDCLNKLQEKIGDSAKDKTNPAYFKYFYDNFWSSDLEIRAFIMKKFLDAGIQPEKKKTFQGDEEFLVETRSKKEKTLDYIIDMHFDKDSEYYKESKRVIQTVYKHLQPYERDLIIAALAAAAQKTNDEKTRLNGDKVGEGLRLFFENKGPAFIKFGQFLSYLPVLDPTIRSQLKLLRENAPTANRDEIFIQKKQTLPNSENKKISHVGKVLGAGSLYVTLKVKYDNKDCVMSLLRPHAKELIESGMNLIENVVNDLSEQNPMYEPIKNVVRQAKISAQNEIKIEKDYEKYYEATQIYHQIKIKTPAGEFTPEVAKWESYGHGPDGLAYKIMDQAKGNSLTSSELSTEQKHQMALAYTTLELCNLISGKKWDTDRHQGQQNFSQNKEFNDFIIGIFDTGAQIEQKPKLKDKIMLGEMLYGMVRAARLGKNISDYMIEKVQAFDNFGKKYNIDTLYIDNVQRGLMTLSDIMTYQKEIRNDKGEIIQEEKSLTPKDMDEICTAIAHSRFTDKKIMGTFFAKGLLNKFRPTREGWRASLLEGLSFKNSNIRIMKRPHQELLPHIAPTDKPASEVEQFNQKESEHKKFGIDTRHIKSSNDM